MNLYQLTGQDKSVLTQDLFRMLGLQNLEEKEKEAFLDKFIVLVLRYFLQEKVQDGLANKEDLEKLAKAYEAANASNPEEVLDRIAELVPNASELFSEALTEVKARVVRDHYTQKLVAAQEKSDSDKEKKYQTYLTYINEGRFDLINVTK